MIRMRRVSVAGEVFEEGAPLPEAYRSAVLVRDKQSGQEVRLDCPLRVAAIFQRPEFLWDSDDRVWMPTFDTASIYVYALPNPADRHPWVPAHDPTKEGGRGIELEIPRDDHRIGWVERVGTVKEIETLIADARRAELRSSKEAQRAAAQAKADEAAASAAAAAPNGEKKEAGAKKEAPAS